MDRKNVHWADQEGVNTCAGYGGRDSLKVKHCAAKGLEVVFVFEQLCVLGKGFEGVCRGGELVRREQSEQEIWRRVVLFVCGAGDLLVLESESSAFECFACLAHYGVQSTLPSPRSDLYQINIVRDAHPGR